MQEIEGANYGKLANAFMVLAMGFEL